MAVSTAPPTTTATAFLKTVDRRLSSANTSPLRRIFPANKSSKILAMAPKKKVHNKQNYISIIFSFRVTEMRREFNLNHHE